MNAAVEFINQNGLGCYWRNPITLEPRRGLDPFNQGVFVRPDAESPEIEIAPDTSSALAEIQSSITALRSLWGQLAITRSGRVVAVTDMMKKQIELLSSAIEDYEATLVSPAG